MAQNDIYLVRESSDGTFEEIANSPFRYDAASATDSPDKANNTFHINTKLRVDELEVNGDTTVIHTDSNTTEQLSVTNDGTGPAAIINQIGAEPLIDIQDDGVSALYIEDGGNVGIGTTNPVAPLHVIGNSVFADPDGIGSYLIIGHPSIEGAQSAQIRMYDSNDVLNMNLIGGGSYEFLNGNVGIGAASPSMRLDVREDKDTTYNVANHGPSWTAMLRNHEAEVAGRFAGIGFQSASPAGGYATGWIGVVSKDKVGDMVFGIRDEDGSAKNYHEAMRITSSSNVGIGNTSPNEKLRVTAGSNLRIMGFEAPLNGSTNQLIARLMGETNGSNFTDSKISFDMASKDGTVYEPTLTLLSGGGVTIGSNGGVSQWGTFQVNNSTGDGTPTIDAWNQSTNSENAHAIIRTAVKPGGGDAYYRAVVDGELEWSFGLDSSDENKFKINSSGELGNALDRLTITATGDVGIGTDSPNATLHVKGDARVEGDGGSAVLYFGDAVGQPNHRYVAGDISGNILIRPSDASYIGFMGSGQEKMRITPGGNVGIGNTSPVEVLEINKAVPAAYDPTHIPPNGGAVIKVKNTDNSANNNFAGIKFQTASLGGQVGTTWMGAAHSGDMADMIFGTRDSDGSATEYAERMRITSGGSVCIGTTVSPWGTLQIDNITGDGTPNIDAWNQSTNSENAHAIIRTAVKPGGGDAYFRAVVDGENEWSFGIDSSDGNSFKINSSGVLGATGGTAGDRFKIDLNGDIHFTGDLYQNGALFTGGGGGSTGSGGTSFGGGSASNSFPNPLDVSGDTSSGVSLTINSTYDDGTGNAGGAGNNWRFQSDGDGSFRIGAQGSSFLPMFELMSDGSNGTNATSTSSGCKLSVQQLTTVPGSGEDFEFVNRGNGVDENGHGFSFWPSTGAGGPMLTIGTDQTPGYYQCPPGVKIMSSLHIAGKHQHAPGTSYNQNDTELKSLDWIGHKSTYYGVCRFDLTDPDPSDQLYYFHLVFRGAGTGIKYKVEIASTRKSNSANNVHNLNSGYLTDESFAYFEDDLDYFGHTQFLGSMESVGDLEIVERKIYPTRESDGPIWGMAALPDSSDLTADNQANYIVRYAIKFNRTIQPNDQASISSEQEGTLKVQLEVMTAGESNGTLPNNPHFMHVPASTAAADITGLAYDPSPSTANRMHFGWNDVPGAGRTYRIQVATDSGFTNLVHSVASYGAAQESVSGLTANTTYYVRVKANPIAGESMESLNWATMSATTKT